MCFGLVLFYHIRKVSSVQKKPVIEFKKFNRRLLIFSWSFFPASFYYSLEGIKSSLSLVDINVYVKCAQEIIYAIEHH